MTQNIALDIRNNRFPCEGPKAVTLLLDFSQAPSFTVNLSDLVTQSKISEIQTAFVDNADSSFPLIIVCDVTQQRVIIPPNSQAYIAVLNLTPSFTVSSSSVLKIKLHFLNIPCTNCVWSASASGAVPNNVFVTNSPLLVQQTQPVTVENEPNTFLNTRMAFTAVNASCVTIAATSANLDTVITASNFIKLINTGPNTVHIRYGTVAQVAATSDYPLAANESVVLYSSSATHIAAICAATETSTLLCASVN